MKSYKKIIYFLSVFMIGFTSCTTDDGPDVKDNFLNYNIPEIPVTQDYVVGAYYAEVPADGLTDQIWNRLINLEGWNPKDGLYGPRVSPVLGNWKHSNRASPEVVKILQQQVDWAVEAKIDFFILPAINEDQNKLYPNNLNVNNLRFTDLLTGRMGSDGNPTESTTGTSVNLKGLKYALSLNPNSLATNLNNQTPIESVASTTIEGQQVTRVKRFYEVVRRMSDYFSDENYYKVDGKPMFIIKNPHNIYALDTRKFYDDMRKYIKEATGKDMYIVVQQQVWEPAGRFQYTFGDARVDAVTFKDEGGMYNQSQAQRSLLYPQMIDQNWKYNKNFLMSTWGEDFIPSVSPSFNRWVESGGNYNFPIVDKDPKTFATYCNIAKMNIGTKRIVLIDSFNQWKFDAAIEPADPAIGNGYGTQYLEIVKKQFKK